MPFRIAGIDVHKKKLAVVVELSGGCDGSGLNAEICASARFGSI